MKYDTIEIIPDRKVKVKWRIKHTQSDVDRVAVETSPHGLGFFHYPKKKGVEFGFNTLKAHLIGRHEEEIARLQVSLESLKALTIPYANKSRKH